MHNRFYNGMGSGMMFQGWIIPLIILAIIGFSLYMILKNNNETKRDKTSDESALDILDKRYARDEIDDEEYLKKKELIKNRQ
ncbi:MAG: SHOCT domain-containing protein [Pisciglobus halotolerans]|nr:SHOCT domain-containing protein [Pisciglobus halotolerans]